MIRHLHFRFYVKDYVLQSRIITHLLDSQNTGSKLYDASSYLFMPKRQLTISHIVQNDENTNRALVNKSFFINKNKNKETFLEAVRKFKSRERLLRGHIEFINAAVKYLEEYGVERDLEVYKSLLDLMPKGTMIPRNVFQQEFYHFPKHQDCALETLDIMEGHGVMPDSELYNMMVNTFGTQGRPVLKLARMLYWMPKFKYACPWALPSELPTDALELAKLALIQINSVDPASKISVLQTKDVKDSIDETWIVSAIAPTQQELLSQHSPKESLKVEGPFGVILHDQRISYFVLRAEPKQAKPKPKRAEIDDVQSLFVWVSEEGNAKEKELIKARSVHEQADGIIMATCATGTSSRDSLLSWIRLLEKSNPSLANIPILFTQASPIGDVILSSDHKKKTVDSESEQPPLTDY